MSLYAKVFPDPLIVRWLNPEDQAGGRRVFEIRSLHRQVHDDGTVHEVDRGDRSDGASIPRFLWRLESPYGRSLEAAVHHDRKYRLKEGTRAEADRRFLEGLAVLGIPAWKRQVMFAAIRAFGGGGWGA